MIVGIATISLAALAIGFFGQRAARRMRGRFSNRAELTIERMWDEELRGEGATLESLRDVLEFVGKTIGVSPRLLRPNDRLEVEFAPEKGWEFDHEMAEVRWWVGERARSAGATVDFSGVKTLSDIARLLDSYRPRKG